MTSFSNDTAGFKQLAKFCNQTTVIRVIYQGTGAYHKGFEWALGPHFGAVCAATFLIEMPMTRQSGQWRGKSFIQGGRKVVRDARHMPALVAMRCNPDLMAKYQAMIKVGKPPIFNGVRP